MLPIPQGEDKEERRRIAIQYAQYNRDVAEAKKERQKQEREEEKNHAQAVYERLVADVKEDNRFRETRQKLFYAARQRWQAENYDLESQTGETKFNPLCPTVSSRPNTASELKPNELPLSESFENPNLESTTFAEQPAGMTKLSSATD